MRRPRVLLALCGVALGLVLAEGAARLTGEWLCADVPGVVLESDATLGWRQRPQLRGWAAFCRGRVLRPTLVTTDERGFLNPGRPIDKPPGTARILLLGGNVPQAFGVPWRLSIAGMLEGRADARRGRPLEVVNGAMGSFGLDQDLLLLREEGARVAPDLVLAVIDPVVEVTAVSPELIALASSRAPVKPYFDVDDGKLVPRDLPAAEPAPPREPGPTGPLAWSALYRLWHGIARDPGEPPSWLPVLPVPTDAPAEAGRGDRVLRALLIAMQEETTKLGARLALVLVPPPRAPRFGEEMPGHHMLTMARELGIPAQSLSLAFNGLPAMFGNTGYLPESTRFNADGHFLASNVVWQFLAQQKLLPEGVVPVVALGGGRVPPLDPFPQALLAAVSQERTGGVARLVGASLAAVVLCWLAAPLPRRLRDWATIAASLLPIALLAGPKEAGLAVAVVVVTYGVAEIGPAWLRRFLAAVVLAAIVVGPIVWLSLLSTDRSVPVRLYVGLATAMGLVRVASYVHERRRRGVRPPIADYLLGMLFFPTFAGGPIQSVWALRRARAADRLAPDDTTALGRVLVGAGRGALRLAWGAAKVVVAPLVLGLLTPDVLASSGDAVPRWRLWVWLVETSLYLWIIYGGLSDMGIGLAAMVGVRVPENFRRPWAATTLADFWRRTLVTVTVRLRRLAGRPVARRFGGPAGAFATCLAGALWMGCSAFALYGAIGSRMGAWAGLVLWAAIHTTGIVASRGLERGGAARMLGWTTTHLLVALAWVPLVAFPFGTLGTIVRIYARLFGFR